VKIKKVLIVWIILMMAIGYSQKMENLPTAEEVWAGVDAKLSGLQDYTSSFKAEAGSRDLFIKFHGKIFCRLPDKVKFVLEGLPDFLSKHSEIINENSVSQIIQRDKFNHRLIGQEKIEDKTYYILQSTAKDTGNNLVEALFWINPQNYTSDKIILKYKDGGYIKVLQEYQLIEGFPLPVSQKIKLMFPLWRAEIRVYFSDFKINPGLGKDFFVKQK